jgi:hypothetical protein
VTEVGEPLTKAAPLVDQILERLTALDRLDSKTVAYYTLATHRIEHVSIFPRSNDFHRQPKGAKR